MVGGVARATSGRAGPSGATSRKWPLGPGSTAEVSAFLAGQGSFARGAGPPWLPLGRARPACDVSCGPRLHAGLSSHSEGQYLCPVHGRPPTDLPLPILADRTPPEPPRESDSFLPISPRSECFVWVSIHGPGRYGASHSFTSITSLPENASHPSTPASYPGYCGE